MFFFTNVQDAWKAKADTIIKYLSRHSGITGFVGSRSCPITLITTANPASVLALDRVVKIELADWYFEKYSLGYIMGMLCHEFAVHPMGDDPYNVQAENMGRDLPMEFGVSGMTVVASRAPQPDHIFASVPGLPRSEIYRNAVLEMALILQKRDLRLLLTKDQFSNEVGDLFDCYLMDMASILATNDHRDQGVVKAGIVATVYNSLRDFLLETLRNNNAHLGLTKHMPRKDKTMSKVIAAYKTLGLNYAGGRLGSTSIVSPEEQEQRLNAEVNPSIGNLRVFQSIRNSDL